MQLNSHVRRQLSCQGQFILHEPLNHVSCSFRRCFCTSSERIINKHVHIASDTNCCSYDAAADCLRAFGWTIHHRQLRHAAGMSARGRRHGKRREGWEGGRQGAKARMWGVKAGQGEAILEMYGGSHEGGKSQGNKRQMSPLPNKGGKTFTTKWSCVMRNVFKMFKNA